MTLNIVLLVLSILLAAFFLLFMVQPFLDRARKESRRIAELLSQLPAELNVEKLVQEALVGSGVHGDEGSRKGAGADGSGHGSGRHDDAAEAVPVAGAAGPKGAEADDEDAAKGGGASSDDDDKASVASSG